MHAEIGGLDKNTWPDASHQFLFADQLTRAFKQNNQDLESATSEQYWLVAFQQKKLCRNESKQSERNFSWRGADPFRSFREGWLDRVRPSNDACHAKPWFGMKVGQCGRLGPRQTFVHGNLACVGQ